MLGIIIQARMGSSRLPGKILKKIGNKTLLEHIFFRMNFLRHKASVVLATSTASQDDIVEKFSLSKKITCFRGSENNVLERYYLCAKQHNFAHIIRLTADNPFVDMEELDRLIDFHLDSRADYTHSFEQMPLGCGSEIFTFKTLETSYFCGHQPNHLEHVNEYITDNPQKFKIAVLKIAEEKCSPYLRLTVDTEHDYQRACFIAANSRFDYITTVEAINLCMRFA